MTPEQFQRVKTLVRQALERAPGEREAFLDSSCDDREVRAEVELLLRHRTSDGAVANVLRVAGEALGAAAGSRIGPYRLSRLLGEGGMGEVWLAEQQEPVERRVALKVIKAGMDTGEVVARFEAERQALAVMDHSAIARVYEAGETPRGRPYFVMEYVSGPPIIKYCDRERLTIPERLELFVQVCEGVQHAHRRAILHRDLKPSNVLVATEGGRPAPKIIDFGLAKATTRRLTERTLQTQLGQVLGTPAYMSPEQLALGGEDVDTRTDVYSLGVLLYELLTGVLPFDAGELRRSDFDELRRRIREHEPPRPSSRLRQLGDAAREIAGRRGSEALAVTRTLRGELDWITIKALEKDRERRYGSAAELAQDIRRFLAHQPVLAAPPGVGYRARKFVRRNRLAVIAAGAVAVAVLAGFAGTAVGLVRALRAEQEARREALTASEVTEFMVGLFGVKGFRAPEQGDPTARELLERGAERIESELAAEPEVRTRLMHTMGRAYTGLGLLEEGERFYRAALDERRARLGNDHPETLAVVRDLGFFHWAFGPLDRAETLLEQAVEGYGRSVGVEHPETLRAMSDLANLYLRVGRMVEAEQLHRRVLATQRRVLGEDHPDTLESVLSLGAVFRDLGRYEEAERMCRLALEGQLRVLGDEHFATTSTKMSLARALRDLGRLEEAEPLLQQALDGFIRASGERQKPALKARLHLGELRRKQGRPAEAETLVRRVVEHWRSDLGTDHPDTLHAEYYLGLALGDLGRHDEAEPLLRSAFEGRRAVIGPGHPGTVRARDSLAALYAAMRMPERAADVLGDGPTPAR